MKMRSIAPSAMVAVLALASLVGFVGCELDSADSFTREVEGRVDFSGFYTGDGGHLVRPANSGLRVNNLNLFQSGDQLEAICNNRHRYKGSLHEVRDKASGFTLIGRTSAGKDVTLTGTLTADGTSGKMRGTWIESDRYCQVYGVATVAPPPTNKTSVSLVVTPTSVAVGGKVTLTASGASTYNWSSSGASGTFENGNDTDGNNTWTATGAGTATLTATAASGGSGSASQQVTVTGSSGTNNVVVATNSTDEANGNGDDGGGEDGGGDDEGPPPVPL